MHYVLGFQFNNDGDRVALIKKGRPEWQAGLWNGIGGGVERGEPVKLAMEREFQEETELSQRTARRSVEHHENVGDHRGAGQESSTSGGQCLASGGHFEKNGRSEMFYERFAPANLS